MTSFGGPPAYTPPPDLSQNSPGSEGGEDDDDDIGLFGGEENVAIGTLNNKEGGKPDTRGDGDGLPPSSSSSSTASTMLLSASTGTRTSTTTSSSSSTTTTTTTSTTTAKVSSSSQNEYAFATLMLTSEYTVGAMVLCQSIRLSAKKAGQEITPNIHLVAYLPTDYKSRNIDAEKLKCCYTDIKVIDLWLPSILPWFPRFREQYTKLRLFGDTQFKKIIYLDSDMLMVDYLVMKELFERDITFGAVQDFYDQGLANSLNGGMLVIKPSSELLQKITDALEPALQAKKYRADQAEQGFLNYFFDFPHGLTVLPPQYNLNSMTFYRLRSIWDQYRGKAALIHFTLEKPFPDVSRVVQPFLEWHEVYNYEKTAPCLKKS